MNLILKWDLICLGYRLKLRLVSIMLRRLLNRLSGCKNFSEIKFIGKAILLLRFYVFGKVEVRGSCVMLIGGN